LKCAYRLEGGGFGFIIVRSDVVHGYSTVCAVETLAGHSRNSLERSVAVAEIEDGGPIVGEILCESACGAGCTTRNIVAGIGFHGGVEGVLGINIRQEPLETAEVCIPLRQSMLQVSQNACGMRS
jgi:hypothetical protein